MRVPMGRLSGEVHLDYDPDTGPVDRYQGSSAVHTMKPLQSLLFNALDEFFAGCFGCLTCIASQKNKIGRCLTNNLLNHSFVSFFKFSALDSLVEQVLWNKVY